MTADTGFFSVRNLHGLWERGIEGYVPDANLSYELKGRGKGQGMGKSKHIRDPEHRRMRQKFAQRGGSTHLPKKKIDSGTGIRSSETTTRVKTVSIAGFAASSD